MGKQTDAYTNECIKLLDKCKIPLVQAMEKKGALDKAFKETDDLLKAADERDKEIHKQLGIPLDSDVKEAEDAKLNDAKKKDINRKMEKLQDRLLGLHLELGKARDALKAPLNALNKKVVEFDAFINDKAKKGLLTGKKSLPSAQQFIAQMKKQVELMKGALQ